MRRQILIDPRGRRWNVDVPQGRRERMRGLRDRGWLAPDHALLLRRCRSVHTFGMGFPIAVVFLDRHWKVVGVHRTSPARVVLPRARAHHVLECPVGTDLHAGDVLVRPGGSPSSG
jgi:uncharacterized protein